MEKIKHIEITNFKSIKHLEINDCNKINVFIGMPNAGKSNILEALANFDHSLTQANIDYNKQSDIKFPLENIVRFNDISELFFEGNISTNIQISINEISLDIEPKKVKSNFDRFEDCTYNFSHKKNLNKEKVVIILKDFFKLKKYIFKILEKKREKIFLSSLNYPFGYNIGEIISSIPNLRNFVNQFFINNNLKLLIEKSTNDLKIFKEYQDGTVFTLPYNMIADTLQRLIFYKAAIMSNKDCVLLFEEPEAHCFEPYILEFTNSVKYDKNDNQFFIVTHSDFIIQEFLRDEESKNNTNIYLVNNVGGETKVKLLDKKKNDDVYELGMNAFFNFENLWENN